MLVRDWRRFCRLFRACPSTRVRSCKRVGFLQALKGDHTRVRYHSAYTYAPHRLALGSTTWPFRRRIGGEGVVGGIQMSSTQPHKLPWTLVGPRMGSPLLPSIPRSELPTQTKDCPRVW